MRTHRAWLARIKQVSRLPSRRAADAVAAYERIAADAERAATAGVSNWHLEQTWHLLALAQAHAGDHRAAGATLRRLAEHHQLLLTEHRRALVASAGAAAMHLKNAGDVRGARRMVEWAGQMGRGLEPQEFLLLQARKVVGASAKRPAGARRRSRTR